MGRHGERGHAALWVIGSLAISIATGVGVYLVIKDQRAAAAEAARAEPIATQPAPPHPEPAPAPAQPVAPTEIAAAEPADRAEAGAVNPTTGMFGTPGIEGALDRDVVVQAVMATEAKLTKCAADTASRAGVVRMVLMLNRRGGVTTVGASGLDDALDRCVETVLRPVRFGRTTDGNPARIVLPIAFGGAQASDAAAPPPAADDGACDEVACVLENYESPCCAKFKPSRASRRAPAAV